MEKIVYLRPASADDNIKCRDGEVVNGDFLFETSTDEYEWAAGAPSAPQVAFRCEYKALPPFSHLPDSFPSIAISASMEKDDTQKGVLDWLATGASTCSEKTRNAVIAAVKDGFNSFVEATAEAGLFFFPVRAAASWLLADGSLWKLSQPVILPTGYSQGSGCRLRITNADCNEGVVRINLEMDRKPFSVGYTASAEWPSDPLIADLKIIIIDNVRDLNPEATGQPVWLEEGTRGFIIPAMPFQEDDFKPFPDVKGNHSNTGDGEVPDGPVPVKTRPIKLGDPFACKKISEVEAAWPDGSLLPLKLYGSLRLDKWYFLGLAPKVRMTTRGSGWRYFMVETFAMARDGRYHLPTLKFRLQ